MGELVHSTMLPGVGEGKGIHVSYDLEYQTDSDRQSGVNELNSQILTNEYLGKFARQYSDNTIWMLVQVSPTILWVPISGSFTLSETVADMDIYISPSGDDVTGNGSDLYPYQTWTRVFADIPSTIRHTVRIHPEAGTYTDFPELIRKTYLGSGRIIIDASDQTYPVVSGPHTLTAVNGIGAAGPLGPSIATELEISGETWTTDELYGKFMHFTSGNWSGYIVPIFENGADTIQTYADWYDFVIGDTFEIVTCPVVIDLSNRVIVTGEIPYPWDVDYYDGPSAPFKSSFLVSGISFESSVQDPFVFTHICCTFSFCRLFGKSTAYSTNGFLIYSSMDFEEIPNDTFSNTYLTDYYGFAFFSICNNGSPSSTGSAMCMASSNLAQLCTRNTITGDLVPGLSRVYNTMCSIMTILRHTSIQLQYVYVEHKTYGGPALGVIDAALAIISVYLGRNSIGLYTFNSYIQATWFQGETSTGNYAAIVGRSTRVAVLGGSNVSLLGQAGAVQLDFAGASPSQFATWPAVGVSYADGAGSFVYGD